MRSSSVLRREHLLKKQTKRVSAYFKIQASSSLEELEGSCCVPAVHTLHKLWQQHISIALLTVLINPTLQEFLTCKASSSV